MPLGVCAFAFVASSGYSTASSPMADDAASVASSSDGAAPRQKQRPRRSVTAPAGAVGLAAQAREATLTALIDEGTRAESTLQLLGPSP